MRFIILAPILCLLAIVAAYPIQQVRSLEVYPSPLTFLQTKEPADVTQKIYRRGNVFSSGDIVTTNYGSGETDDTPGSQQAKVSATKQMQQDIFWHKPADAHVVNNSVSVT